MKLIVKRFILLYIFSGLVILLNAQKGPICDYDKKNDLLKLNREYFQSDSQYVLFKKYITANLLRPSWVPDYYDKKLGILNIDKMIKEFKLILDNNFFQNYPILFKVCLCLNSNNVEFDPHEGDVYTYTLNSDILSDPKYLSKLKYYCYITFKDNEDYGYNFFKIRLEHDGGDYYYPDAIENYPDLLILFRHMLQFRPF